MRRLNLIIMTAIKYLFIYLIYLITATIAPLSAQVKRGDVIFQTGFEEPSVLEIWNQRMSKNVSLVNGYNSKQALQIKSPELNNSNVSVSIRLPIEKFKGGQILCEAIAKAQDVSQPPNPWNGVKFMLFVESPEGKQWLQQNNIYGTFDWKKLRFRADIPENAERCELILGLEAVSGTVVFDDVKLTVIRSYQSLAEVKVPDPQFKGHNLPRLRGVMIGPRVGTNDIIYLGKEWGANHIRWQLIWGGFPNSPADNGDLDAYDKWMSGELKRLDNLLPVCEQVGIKVLIDIHTPPGGRNKASECNIFYEKRFQNNFIKWWEVIARKYRDNKTVWGYDLMNEPVSPAVVGEGCLDWNELAFETAKRIRAIDPEHAIIIEPEPWGGPESIRNIIPLPLKGIVYSVHMYQPHNFTHQGVYNDRVGIVYPGIIDGKYWDKNRLRVALQPVLDFQRKYDVHIYIGEFSATRWAPGRSAYNYLADLIEIFEEYGWDWAYHAYREWDGWSVEHGPDKKDRSKSKTPTDRELLLRSWFSLNKH